MSEKKDDLTTIGVLALVLFFVGLLTTTSVIKNHELSLQKTALETELRLLKERCQ